MSRWKAIVSYDGTNFLGYQVQASGRTVQQEIETVLKKMHKGLAVRIAASGRTDAGVHAIGQVIHWDSALTLASEAWKKALNAMLPHDIHIEKVERVNDDFHARYGAVKKTYHYHLHIGSEPNVFNRHFAYHFPYPLALAPMREAMERLCGTHDFTSFSSARSTVEDKVRTIYSYEVQERGQELIFKVTGSGFLYNMVRIMTGTLLDVGQGRISPAAIDEMLLAKNREAAGKTAPAHGLYLYEVQY
ncbi:tRNA pseudouridine synthase A [Fictibacillus macauensis ZFHKF-1]|uniref:tRNA pseudouridine synthase A n=1 Tax=Fictibacillus macauensis ZFHKF-1 TaxID=1196324 RepID=I8AF97_9BACL|nr:tRNA pseudouridine(38-40) synthase TruA [Fictibacillus macauensis]EIT84024.1 tRNA pseudouridine synthase A [Fictibacillus macauensis ZFHKF-1]